MMIVSMGRIMYMFLLFVTLSPAVNSWPEDYPSRIYYRVLFYNYVPPEDLPVLGCKGKANWGDEPLPAPCKPNSEPNEYCQREIRHYDWVPTGASWPVETLLRCDVRMSNGVVAQFDVLGPNANTSCKCSRGEKERSCVCRFKITKDGVFSSQGSHSPSD